MPSQACFASYVSAMPASVHMELKFVSVSGTRTMLFACETYFLRKLCVFPIEVKALCFKHLFTSSWKPCQLKRTCIGI